MSETYLVIFHVGPVQDFIATARRSRDLWYGSWMLSELSKAAAEKVMELFPGTLVFPAPDLLGKERNLNVPNKIVAIIEGEPGTLGKQVKDAVFDRMKKLGEDALQPVKSRIHDNDLAMQQIMDLPEFYWVSVAYYTDDEYPKARNQAEALLAARKTTRDFKQVAGSNAPKSSLDGARESVIPESDYSERSDSDEARKEKIKKLYRHYHARQGERLSGVDLLKRLGERKAATEFRSTSHMAALPFLEKLGTVKANKLVAEICALFEDPKWKEWNIGERDDGALLYESRLAEWIPAGTEQNTLRQELNKIMERYAGKFRPSPYYALLAADGDNMGVVIDAQKEPETHRDLSGALSQFAAEVLGIVENNKTKGVLIYAGGDDVLAYLPLHTVLECAEKLEKAFRQKLGEFQAQKNGKTITPTLSIGIVIAHHLEPLADVLELARNAEKEAKKVDDKNGLAITLRKRGGADRTINGKWSVFYKRLSHLIDFYRKDALSGGTAYELQELHRILSKTGIPADGLAQEALRIVARKKEAGGGKDVSDDVKRAFQQWLDPKKDHISLAELAKEMIVAGMFTSDTEPLDEPVQSTEEVTQ